MGAVTTIKKEQTPLRASVLYDDLDLYQDYATALFTRAAASLRRMAD